MTYEFYAFWIVFFLETRNTFSEMSDLQLTDFPPIVLNYNQVTSFCNKFKTVWCSLVTSILKLLNTKSYLNLFSRTGFSVAFISCLTLYLSLVRWGCLWVYDYLIIISLFLSVMAWENWFLHQSLSSSNDKAPLTLTLI